MITNTERTQEKVASNQMNIEALAAFDVDALELEPIMGYSNVNFMSPLDLLKKVNRPAGMADDERWLAYAKRSNGDPVRYLTYKDSFKITVNPRYQVQILIWSFGKTAGEQLLRSYSAPYDDLAEKIQTFVSGRYYGLDLVLNEGDFVEFDAETGRFTVMASKEIVVDNVGDRLAIDGIEVATIAASYYEPSEEQIETEGLLDDPLTEEDEYVAPSSTTPYSDRIAKIKRELMFKNKGRRIFGGIAFFLIGVGLVYFISRLPIFTKSLDEIRSGVEGGVSLE